MRLLKYLKTLSIKFTREEMEREYISIKGRNVIPDFKACMRFMILLNIVVCIGSIIATKWIDGVISISMAVFSIILYSFQKFIARKVQILTILVIILYNLSRFGLFLTLYQGASSTRTYLSGYGTASVQIILLLRLSKFTHQLIITIGALALRFGLLAAVLEPEKFEYMVLIRHMVIDGFMLYTIYFYESELRKMFKSFYENREELLKFKEFLDDSLPQSLTVVACKTSELLFSNKTFLSTFDGSHHDLESPSSPTIAFGRSETEHQRLHLGSLKVDLSTVREIKASNWNLPTMEFSNNPLYFKEVLEALIRNHQLNDRVISLVASYTYLTTKRSFEVTLKKIKWDHQDAIAVLFNDITYQENIMALKMANLNKDQVIGIVSHELRTPLSGIIGILEIAEKKIENPEVLGYLSLCIDNAQLLLSLVNSILDLQQVSSGKLKLNPEKVDLHKTLNDLVKLFNFQCSQKNLSLQVNIHKNVPMCVNTDESRLKQILINLIGNALKFTSKGGIGIEVIKDPRDPERLRISVEDTGIGIKEQDKQKLFKMYGKLEDGESVNKNGIGLGLTISNVLAAILNKSIDGKGIQVESQFGEGSKFYFWILIDIEKESQSSKKEHLNEPKDIKFLEESSAEFHSDTTGGLLIKKARSIMENKKFQDLSREDFDQEIFDEYLGAVEIEANMSQHHTPQKMQATSTFKYHSTQYKIKVIGGLKSNKNFQTAHQKLNNETSVRKKSSTHIVKPDMDLGYILIVDDNPFNVLVAKNIIQELGYTTKTALGGQEAIETVKHLTASGLPLKAIVMDCQMPMIDGFETTEILLGLMERNEIPKIPIFGWTANNSEEDIKKCFESGMVGYLPKPAAKTDIARAFSIL